MSWLTLFSISLAVLMAGLAVCMGLPIRWDGPGILGAGALFYPLHLLLFTGLTAVLAFVAKSRHAEPATWMFLLVTVLTAAMALIPTWAIWHQARKDHVRLSLGNYLANALHANAGTPQRDRTVVYGVAKNGTKLELDVWSTGLPKSGAPRPAIVMVHGGGWCHGNRSMTPDWNRWLNELGYEVFDVEYRLAPPVRWLDEVGDVKSALGWLAAHAVEYHVDPKHITLMGWSAGANLALLAGYSMGDPSLPPSTEVPAVTLQSVINIYGPTDMALLYRTCPSSTYIQKLLRDYIGGSPEEFPDRYQLLSPLSHITSKSPPTLTLLGTSDRLISMDHATLLDQALRGSGVTHKMCLFPANDHAFDSNWGGFGTQIARAKIESFLKSY